MFCDICGFTRLAEQMAPADLQAFLNIFFSRLSEIISAHRGTVQVHGRLRDGLLGRSG